MLTVFSIVRNEEAVIRRMVLSALTLADRLVVVDTGSSDDTIKILNEFENVEVHERDWVSFGENLTEAVALARPGSDWLLRMDADMIISDLHPNFYSWLHDDARAAAYSIELVEGNATWRLPLLMSANYPWNYVGETHEYLDPKGKIIPDVEGLRIRHIADGSNRANKFERDIDLLMPGVINNDPRALFYAAESFRCLGDINSAYNLFQMRADQEGTWEEERWFAQYRAAECLMELDPQRGLKAMYDAWLDRPQRAEPLQRIVEFANRKKPRSLSTDTLFVEPGAYL